MDLQTMVMETSLGSRPKEGGARMSTPAAQPASRWSEIGLVAFVFGVLMCMILPMRPWMLDMMLAMSISSGLLVMLVIIYIRDPSEFTSFPTLLLIVTLFRLGLILPPLG